MEMLQPINKHTVLKAVRDHGKWEGYIAPSNVNSFHITGGWNLGMALVIVDGKREGLPTDKPYVFNESTESFQELGTLLNSFRYYNCNSELGNRIRFWGNE
jgi:hypothetical protein